MGEGVINSDPFGAVFGSSKADGSGLERLPHIASFAVKQGFAILPCAPDTGELLCPLPGRPKPHDCGLAHTFRGEDQAQHVMGVFRRLARVHGPVNIAVVPHLSGMLHIEVRGPARRAWLAERWDGSPTVLHGDVAHHWFRLPPGVVPRVGKAVPVPPSVISGVPLRMVSPPREAPENMLIAARLIEPKD
jgi:hypothetical protein